MSLRLVPAAGEWPAPRKNVRQPPPVPALVHLIIREVAEREGLTEAMLIGPQQNKTVVMARHLAFWRAYRETGATLDAIGLAFGGRDHSTISNGIRRHEERLNAALAERKSCYSASTCA